MRPGTHRPARALTEISILFGEHSLRASDRLHWQYAYLIAIMTVDAAEAEWPLRSVHRLIESCIERRAGVDRLRSRLYACRASFSSIFAHAVGQASLVVRVFRRVYCAVGMWFTSKRLPTTSAQSLIASLCHSMPSLTRDYSSMRANLIGLLFMPILHRPRTQRSGIGCSRVAGRLRMRRSRCTTSPMLRTRISASTSFTR